MCLSQADIANTFMLKLGPATLHQIFLIANILYQLSASIGLSAVWETPLMSQMLASCFLVLGAIAT